MVMRGPWEPDLTWRDRFGPLAQARDRLRQVCALAGTAVPPAYAGPSEREARWRAEDDWLRDQWLLTM